MLPALNVLHVLMVEYLGGAKATPCEVEGVLAELAVSPPDPSDPSTIEAWGTSREAQQGQAAMMQMLG